jgi:hypothetical protein
MSDKITVMGSAVPLVPNQEPRVGSMVIRQDATKGKGTQDLHERVTALEELVKQQQKDIDDLKAKFETLTGGK